MTENINLSSKGILSKALPLMLGSLFTFILTLTDTSFLGNLNDVELAKSWNLSINDLANLAINTGGNASLIYMTLLLTAQGLCEAFQIRVAHFLGLKDSKSIQQVNHTAIGLAVIFSSILFCIGFFGSSSLLPKFVEDPVLCKSMISFMEIRSFGFFPALLQLTLLFYFIGMAETKIMTYSMLVSASVNIFLDYTLIFGNLSFPKLGIEGAAYASVIAEFCSFFFVLLFTYYYKEHRKNWFHKFEFVFERAKTLLVKGFPLMIQRFISMAAWTVFFLFIEKMGNEELAISQIIRTLYFLAFIPAMGFNSTVRTYVSYYLSQGRIEYVKKSIIKISIISAITTFVVIHGFWFYPESIIGIITPQENLINGTTEILLVISYSMIIFSVAGVCFSAVAGLGFSNTSMYIEIINILFYLLFAYLVTFTFKGSLLQLWCIEFLYFGLLALFSIAFLTLYPWQKKHLKTSE